MSHRVIYFYTHISNNYLERERERERETVNLKEKKEDIVYKRVWKEEKKGEEHCDYIIVSDNKNSKKEIYL